MKTNALLNFISTSSPLPVWTIHRRENALVLLPPLRTQCCKSLHLFVRVNVSPTDATIANQFPSSTEPTPPFLSGALTSKWGPSSTRGSIELPFPSESMMQVQEDGARAKTGGRHVTTCMSMWDWTLHAAACQGRPFMVTCLDSEALFDAEEATIDTWIVGIASSLSLSLQGPEP